MNKFEILEHTADIRLMATGDTIAGLFEAALAGMNSIIKENVTESEGLRYREKISLESVDQTTLLIDFLSRILTLTHQNHSIYCEPKFDLLSGKKLTADLTVISVNEFDEDIKAVTYTEAEIIKTEEGKFQTIIIFDI